MNHLNQLGQRLRQSNESFNKTVGSLDSNVLPAARTLKELNATSEDDIEKPVRIEVEPRQINRDELLLPVDEEQ